MTLDNMNISFKVDTKELQTGFKAVRSGLATVKSGIASVVKTGLALGDVTLDLRSVVDAAKAYVGLESNVQRINGLFSQSSKYISYFATMTGKSYGMAETAAYRYAAVYGDLFRGITASTEENAAVTVAMLKASAVVASKTGRTMDDVTERIRSGLTGDTEAVEELGLYTDASMLEATDAFKKIANGRSWEQLASFEQRQIRTLAILEQAHQTFGDTVQQDGAYRLSMLSGALSDLQATAGSFANAGLQPIIQALIQVVQWATAGLRSLSSMLGLQPSAAGGAADTADSTAAALGSQQSLTAEVGKTGEEAKRAAAGFDVFNDISASGSGSSKGAAGPVGGPGAFADLAMPEYKAVEPDTTWVDTLRDKFDELSKSEPFQTIAAALSEAWTKISPVLAELGTTFGGIWADIQTLATPFGAWFSETFVPGLGTAITSAGSIVANVLDSVNLVVSGVWTALQPLIEGFITDLLPVITSFAAEAWLSLDTFVAGVKGLFDSVWTEGVKPALDEISKIWTDVMGILHEKWDEYGAPIFQSFREALDNLTATWQHVWDEVLKPIWDKIMETVDWLWEEHLRPLVVNIADFAAKFAQAALDVYNNFIAPIVNWFIETLGPGIASTVETIVSVIGTIVGTVTDIVSGIIESLSGITDFISGIFTGNWEQAWNGIVTFFRGIGDSISGVFKGAVNLIIDYLNTMIRALNHIKIEIPDWVPLIGGRTFGFSIPEIPKLAGGGLVYGEVQALVGDNYNARQDPEVIAPLSSLKGMILEALLQRDIATGGGKEIRITMTMPNGEVLADMMVDPLNAAARNLGYAPVFAPQA